MKTAKYRLVGGGERVVEYDETAPCWACGLPVMGASMGGTVLCPWCDCGNHRDGSKINWHTSQIYSANWNRSKAVGHWDGMATGDQIEAQVLRTYNVLHG